MGKHFTDRPTIQAIVDRWADIQVVWVETDESVTRILPKNTDQRALRLLELARTKRRDRHEALTYG